MSFLTLLAQAHEKSVVSEPCSSGWCLKVHMEALLTLHDMTQDCFVKTKMFPSIHLRFFPLQILEGRDKNFGDDDFGIATERQCLQRPPSDNTERCAYVKQNHKRKFMCFCKGDLCNSSPSHSGLLPLLLLPVLLALMY